MFPLFEAILLLVKTQTVTKWIFFGMLNDVSSKYYACAEHLSTNDSAL